MEGFQGYQGYHKNEYKYQGYQGYHKNEYKYQGYHKNEYKYQGYQGYQGYTFHATSTTKSVNRLISVNQVIQGISKLD